MPRETSGKNREPEHVPAIRICGGGVLYPGSFGYNSPERNFSGSEARNYVNGIPQDEHKQNQPEGSESSAFGLLISGSFSLHIMRNFCEIYTEHLQFSGICGMIIRYTLILF